MTSGNQPNTFSAVLLGDLNDFIAPSQACINPIFVGGNSNESMEMEVTQEKKKVSTIQLRFENDPLSAPTVLSTKNLIKVDRSTKAAKVSLSDCLACSGCVTSAETVLLKQQSVQEFLHTMRVIRDGAHPNFKVAAVTISPQVRASLSVRFNCKPLEVHAKLAHFFRYYCGVEFVLDAGSLPSDISQLEVAREFVKRYKLQHANNRAKTLPMLTSNCPGWVCYAEKTHAYSLPFLCDVKSPQQIAGSILKRSLQASRGLAPYEIYHVSVMQCPDKKLEGSRREFWLEADERSAEVNCVLTATELCDALLEVFQQDAESLDNIFEQKLFGDASFLQTNDLERSFSVGTTSEEKRSGGSGGLCAFVFRYAAKELFGVEIPNDTQLPFRPGRNPDTWSLELEIDGSIALRFAASYGFRNIQDVVRRLKNGTSNVQFIEVMACPGGCTNGGGLLPPHVSESTVVSRKQLSEMVSNVMDSIPHTVVDEHGLASKVIRENPHTLHTTFNAIKDTFQTSGLVQTW
jgi:iron only hydrogenase large subunit-like protein